MCLLTERKLCPTPLTSEQVRRTLLMGLFLHSFLILLGFIGFIIVSTMEQDEKGRLLLAIESEKASHSCADLMMVSMMLVMISGIAGLVFQFMSYPKVSAFMLPTMTALPLGLAVIGLVDAVSIDERGFQQLLRKSFIREAYNKHHHDWNQAAYSKTVEWDRKLQGELKCCGVVDKRDWFFSICNCIPTSCCKKNKHVECEKNFLRRTSSGILTERMLGTNPSNFVNNEMLLWKETCITKLESVVGDIRKKWIDLILYFICIDVCAPFLVAHLCFIIQELNVTERGQNQLEEYRWSLPVRKRLTPEHMQGTFYTLQKLRSKELQKKRNSKKKATSKSNRHSHPIVRDFIEIKPPTTKS